MTGHTHTIELWYGDLPPSLNEVGSRGGKFAYPKVKKRWQKIVGDLLLVARLPEQSFVAVSAVLFYAARRRRDEGNMRFLLEKVTGDALVQTGVLVDDTPEHFRFDRVRFEIDKAKAPRTELHLTLNDDTEGRP